MTNLPDFTSYCGPRQKHIDWLKGQGVDIWSMIRPWPIQRAVGVATPEPERFVEDPNGEDWLVFREARDSVYWNPDTGQLICGNGLSFALGEEAIWNAGTCALDGYLELHATPLEWLRSGRKGIVIVRWPDVYEHLRAVPRIHIPPSLDEYWDRFFKPQFAPKVYVKEPSGRAAA